jgi:hypothetical protein
LIIDIALDHLGEWVAVLQDHQQVLIIVMQYKIKFKNGTIVSQKEELNAKELRI